MNKQNIGKNQLLNNVSYNINMNENLKKTKENHQNKKLESINKLSNKYDINKLKNLILGAESSVTNNGRETVNLYDNLKCEYDEKDKKFQYKLNEYWLKRTNEPYKNIIKDKQYYEKFLQKEKLQLIDPNELIIHKTGESDKKGFDDECEKYTKGIELHNNEIKTIYSMTNELEHKKKFEYEHKYKYNISYDQQTHNELKDILTKTTELANQCVINEDNKVKNIMKNLDDTKTNFVVRGGGSSGRICGSNNKQSHRADVCKSLSINRDNNDIKKRRGEENMDVRKGDKVRKCDENGECRRSKGDENKVKHKSTSKKHVISKNRKH